MIRAGIIGGAGYTSGELVRILVNHPEVELCFVASESNAGNLLSDVHDGILGDTDMCFCRDFSLADVDVLFMCGAHGRSRAFWQEHRAPEGLKIIDLAQDFRDESDGYVYGLPELNAERIRKADKVANPGCFATAIQLALLPLAAQGLLEGDVCITAITGSTGAGVKPGSTTHFSWRNNNISVYKVFEHQHLAEISRSVRSLQPKFNGSIDFVPVRGDFARGIFVTAVCPCAYSTELPPDIFRQFYKGAAFTFVSDNPLSLKQVVNTNKCIVNVERFDRKYVVTCVIDNLLKGASGQAVQNMNLMFGLEQDTGLKLKASAF